jgi:hypothetical protein
MPPIPPYPFPLLLPVPLYIWLIQPYWLCGVEKTANPMMVAAISEATAVTSKMRKRLTLFILYLK